MNDTGTAAHAGTLAASSHPAAMIVLSPINDQPSRAAEEPAEAQTEGKEIKAH
jgi:hypothetical protein